ncbi:MAG: SRPBCC family protein [Parvularculaceae bacterium]
MIVQDSEDENETTLILDVILDAPRSAVWRCWTESDLLKEWYCPKPWRVTKIDQDLRAGGRNNGVMEGPNGERIENTGCFLAVEPQKSLEFTDYFSEGFVPRRDGFMVGFVRLSDAQGGKTRMIWGARHADKETTKKHLDMGFRDGWKAAAAQLEELVKSIA